MAAELNEAAAAAARRARAEGGTARDGERGGGERRDGERRDGQRRNGQRRNGERRDGVGRGRGRGRVEHGRVEHGRLGRDGSGRAVALPLDLASLDSVRAFPAALDGAGLPPLRAVVANAGVQRTDRRHTTADGFEETFGTNHLGHFLLIRLLLDRLIDRGRVVLVSSGTHKPQRLRNFGFPPPRWAPARALATPGDGSGQVAYATSKLANAMTALELSRRIETLRPGARIAVHAFDPGLMPETGLAQHYPAPARRAYARLAPLLARLPGATTVARSGELLAGVAIDHLFGDRPNGRYVEWDGGEGAYSAQARDARAAAELWRDSERLVGLGAG